MPKTLKIGQRSIILPNLATLVKPAKVALTNYFRMKDTADEILNHFLLHKKIKKRFLPKSSNDDDDADDDDDEDDDADDADEDDDGEDGQFQFLKSRNFTLEPIRNFF